MTLTYMLFDQIASYLTRAHTDCIAVRQRTLPRVLCRKFSHILSFAAHIRIGWTDISFNGTDCFQQSLAGLHYFSLASPRPSLLFVGGLSFEKITYFFASFRAIWLSNSSLHQPLPTQVISSPDLSKSWHQFPRKKSASNSTKPRNSSPRCPVLPQLKLHPSAGDPSDLQTNTQSPRTSKLFQHHQQPWNTHLPPEPSQRTPTPRLTTHSSYPLLHVPPHHSHPTLPHALPLH
jgi:hypothetical protein